MFDLFMAFSCYLLYMFQCVKRKSDIYDFSVKTFWTVFCQLTLDLMISQKCYCKFLNQNETFRAFALPENTLTKIYKAPSPPPLPPQFFFFLNNIESSINFLTNSSSTWCSTLQNSQKAVQAFMKYFDVYLTP